MVKFRNLKKIIGSTLSLLMLISFAPAVYAANNITTMRVYGADCGGTSFSFAQGIYRFSPPQTTLYADGYSHIEDALCAVPYAAYTGSPLLLNTADMLKDLHITTTDILSGSSSNPIESTYYCTSGTPVWITSNVTPRIDGLSSPIQNFAGDLNSQDLALKFASKLPAPTYLFIVNEQSYADALSITPYAAHTHSPILYVDQNSVSQSVLDYVKANQSTLKTIYIIGGTGVISDTVMAQFPNAVRLAGEDRYGTCLKVNQTLPPIMYTDVENPIRFMLLNGEDGHLTDGISAAANWGNGEYIFWLTQDSIFPYTKQDIYNAIKPFTVTPPPKWSGNTETIYQPKFPSTMRMFSIAGGPVVVPDSVVNTFAQMLPIY